MRLAIIDLIAKCLRVTFQVNGVSFGARPVNEQTDCS